MTTQADLERAREIATLSTGKLLPGLYEVILKALQETREDEKERCAKIAESYDSKKIASAIREGK